MRRLPPLTILPDVNENGWQFFRQRNFTGGENKLILPEFVAQNQLITAQNCELTPEGIVQTRLGKAKLTTASLGEGGIKSLFLYAKEDGTVYVVAHHETSLYAVEWDGVASITFGAAVKTGVGTEPLRGEVWKDVLILANGTVNPFYFDGAICTDLGGTPPNFAIFTVYANRLWVVDSTAPNIIRWSGLENYDSWDVLDILKVRDADGDGITGLSRQPGGLVITKNQSVWPLYGTNRDNLRLGPTPIEENAGCVASRTLMNVGNSGLFVGDNGFYTFDLTRVVPAFHTHRDVIKSLSKVERDLCFAVAHPSDRRAYINLGNGSTLAIIEQQDISSGQTYYAMFTWRGLNAGCFAIASAPGYSGDLMIGDATVGDIYILNNNVDDDGAGIITIIKTAYNDHGSVIKKVWRRCDPEIELVNAGQYLYEMSHDVDYKRLTGLELYQQIEDKTLDWGNDNWGESFWGFNRERVSEPYFIEPRGHRISFGVKTANRIKFLGYTTKYRETGYL